MTHTFRKWIGAAALLALATGAGACEITRDGVTGVWRGNCNLTIDPKGPKVEQVFIDGVSQPIRLRIPDLIIDKFKFFQNGNDIEVYADIVNLGILSSPIVKLDAIADAVDPVTRLVQDTFTTSPMLSVPVLRGGARLRIYLGTLNVDTSLQDWDVVISGMVDRITLALPSGTAIESNETNNGLIHLCRVYGPNPNTALQPCN
jgi:hypothetical protein